MENVWTYDENETLNAPKKSVVRSKYQENNKRMRAIEVVKYIQIKFDEMFDL
jgi:hypothetical protein